MLFKYLHAIFKVLIGTGRADGWQMVGLSINTQHIHNSFLYVGLELLASLCSVPSSPAVKYINTAGRQSPGLPWRKAGMPGTGVCGSRVGRGFALWWVSMFLGRKILFCMLSSFACWGQQIRPLLRNMLSDLTLTLTCVCFLPCPLLFWVCPVKTVGDRASSHQTCSSVCIPCRRVSPLEVVFHPLCHCYS